MISMRIKSIVLALGIHAYSVKAEYSTPNYQRNGGLVIPVDYTEYPMCTDTLHIMHRHLNPSSSSALVQMRVFDFHSSFQIEMFANR